MRNPNTLVPANMMEPNQVSHQKTLSTGFLGLGSKQTATFSASIPKQCYAMGEQCTVTVTSDNTHCEKAMEQVKVRLRYMMDVNATHNGLCTLNKTKTIGPHLLLCGRNVSSAICTSSFVEMI